MEPTGGLDDVVSPHIAPLNLAGVLLVEDGDLLAINNQAARLGVSAGGARVAAVHRVVLYS